MSTLQTIDMTKTGLPPDLMVMVQALIQQFESWIMQTTIELAGSSVESPDDYIVFIIDKNLSSTPQTEDVCSFMKREDLLKMADDQVFGNDSDHIYEVMRKAATAQDTYPFVRVLMLLRHGEGAGAMSLRLGVTGNLEQELASMSPVNLGPNVVGQA